MKDKQLANSTDSPSHHAIVCCIRSDQHGQGCTPDTIVASSKNIRKTQRDTYVKTILKNTKHKAILVVIQTKKKNVKQDLSE